MTDPALTPVEAPVTPTTPATKAVIEGAASVNVYVWGIVVLCGFGLLAVTLVILIRPDISDRYVPGIFGFVLTCSIALQGLSQRAQTKGLNGRLSQLMDLKGQAERKAGRADVLRQLVWQQAALDPKSKEWAALDQQIRLEMQTQFGVAERRKPAG